MQPSALTVMAVTLLSPTTLKPGRRARATRCKIEIYPHGHWVIRMRAIASARPPSNFTSLIGSCSRTGTPVAPPQVRRSPPSSLAPCTAQRLHAFPPTAAQDVPLLRALRSPWLTAIERCHNSAFPLTCAVVLPTRSGHTLTVRRCRRPLLPRGGAMATSTMRRPTPKSWHASERQRAVPGPRCAARRLRVLRSLAACPPLHSAAARSPSLLPPLWQATSALPPSASSGCAKPLLCQPPARAPA